MCFNVGSFFHQKDVVIFVAIDSANQLALDSYYPNELIAILMLIDFYVDDSFIVYILM